MIKKYSILLYRKISFWQRQSQPFQRYRANSAENGNSVFARTGHPIGLIQNTLQIQKRVEEILAKIATLYSIYIVVSNMR